MVPTQAQDPGQWHSDSRVHQDHLLNLNLHSKDAPPGASEVVDGPQTPEMGNEHRDTVGQF